MLEDEVVVGNEHPIEFCWSRRQTSKRQNDLRNRLEAAAVAQLCSWGGNWSAPVKREALGGGGIRRLRIRLQIRLQGDECIVNIVYGIYLVKLTLKARVFSQVCS